MLAMLIVLMIEHKRIKILIQQVKGSELSQTILGMAAQLVVSAFDFQLLVPGSTTTPPTIVWTTE